MTTMHGMSDREHQDTDLTDPHGEAEMLRAEVEDLLRCVSAGNDPATITGADWRDIADVLDAVCEAERFVGRPDDEYGALLNPVLDARTWEYHA